jgi:hypothetical protein
MSNSNKISFNVQVPGLLGVVLIALKATGYIHWSWFWVLTPFWLPVALFLAFTGFCLGMAVLAAVLDRR